VAAAHNPHKAWDFSHSPVKRPLGCNGKYGASGYNRHLREKTKVCQRCRNSMNHWRRERKRGGIAPRKLQPCGTNAAARRHRTKNEPLDLACRVAEAEYTDTWRKLAREKY